MNTKELLKFLINVSGEMADAALKARELWHKKLDNKKLESKIDYAAANVLKKALSENNLSFKVISEEGFEDFKGSGDYLIVDPVDGTSNFTRGIPYTAVSLAVSKDDSINGIYIGVVRDIYRKDVFWAVKGEGAYLNGKKIHVGKERPLDNSFVSICITRVSYESSNIFKLVPYVRYPRYLGSASLELCYVAMGKFDAFIDIRGSLRVFDVAAGQLIVREAGGVTVIKQDGEKHIRLSKVHGISIIAASNQNVINKILKIINY